jgi:SAM-dependent methyltransferase
VDLATGTGMIARALARRGWAVTALDIAPAMIETAAALAKTEGVSIDARVASAENTGCGAESHDLVTAFCCWHWFDHEAAARESTHPQTRRRLVVGAGFIAPRQCHRLSSALIKRHNPEWTPARLPACPGPMQLPAMFTIIERHDELMDILQPQAWWPYPRASAGVSASMAPEVVAALTPRPCPAIAVNRRSRP